MVFIEAPYFEKWRDEHLDDETFSALLAALEANPAVGAYLGHGLRKLRIRLPGRGKRGGARVIYFYRAAHDRVHLLHGYAKNVQADLTGDQLRRLIAVLDKELGNG
jgi:hypothetical protein